ncbi:MAG TPA: DUF4252 domain-containing protein [Faecalibacter sp.]
MKYFIYLWTCIAIALTFVGCVSLHKSNMDFVASQQLRNESSFVAVNLPTGLAKPFIIRTLKKEGESKEVIAFVKNIKKARILTVANASENLRNDFNDYLEANNMEEFLSVNREGDQIKIHARKEDKGLNRLMIRVEDQQGENVFIDVKGKFSEELITGLIAE